MLIGFWINQDSKSKPLVSLVSPPTNFIFSFAINVWHYITTLNHDTTSRRCIRGAHGARSAWWWSALCAAAVNVIFIAEVRGSANGGCFCRGGSRQCATMVGFDAGSVWWFAVDDGHFLVA